MKYTAILLILTLAASMAAQKPSKKDEKELAGNLPAVIYRDPGEISALNLFYGPGGKEHAPDPSANYKFLKEDLGGTNPKFHVEDHQGVRWRVKLGDEARSETVATRLVWAAGYFVDEDYYLETVTVSGLPLLRRGMKYVSDGGIVHGACMERRPAEIKKFGDWSWFDNPFLGTKELNGLRVMMALLNNSDLKQANNSIYVVEGERRYVMSDLGTAFGKTGNEFTRSKSNVEDYAKSKFIDKVTTDSVDFTMRTRPIPLVVFHLPYYLQKSRQAKIPKRIPLADVEWLGQRLAQLTPEQIRDAFRAGGYTPEEVEGYANVVQKRIAELNALGVAAP